MKLVLIVRTDLKMGKGKIASQCSHATLGIYREIQKNKMLVNNWESTGEAKIVLKCSSLEEMKIIEKKAKLISIPPYIIEDEGRTQIEPGSETVLAIGPGSDNQLDPLIGHLKLL